MQNFYNFLVYNIYYIGENVFECLKYNYDGILKVAPTFPVRLITVTHMLKCCVSNQLFSVLASFTMLFNMLNKLDFKDGVTL